MKIVVMDSFLYWYSQNNKIIIQFLCISIGFILIFFIYRMFFAASDPALDGGDAGSQVTGRQIADLDKKISKIIDHQISASQPVVYTGEASEYEANAMAEAKAEAQIQEELLQLKKELQSAKEMISLKTNELNTAKEKFIDHQKTLPGIETTDLTSDNGGRISGDLGLMAQINELQRKLKEYDIISDDIAELQSLRAENAELKSKVDDKSSAG
ncbi:MAG: hypothetical protein H7Z71_06005 [Moraxellaceae bacterium]|nr:hypothetical protein [Pseudobdellovibrionaceae bacterium]